MQNYSPVVYKLGWGIICWSLLPMAVTKIWLESVNPSTCHRAIASFDSLINGNLWVFQICQLLPMKQLTSSFVIVKLPQRWIPKNFPTDLICRPPYMCFSLAFLHFKRIIPPKSPRNEKRLLEIMIWNVCKACSS